MAVNFDSLPTENPFGLVAADVYKAFVTEAVIKKGKDETKPPYLNIKYELTRVDGTSAGTLYDIFSEADNSVVKYKLSRFLQACNIPLVGQMELSDIAKIVVNKTIVVDVGHSTDNKGKERAQVDLFTREAYYTEDMFKEIYEMVHPDALVPEPDADFMAVPESEDGEVPFDGDEEPTAEY